MKPARDYLRRNSNLFDAIEEAQTEAWNEAIKAAAESARLSVFDFIGTYFKESKDWERFSVNDGTYIEIDKQSILKLLKPDGNSK